MTSLISIRLNDKLLREMRLRAQILHLSQTDYIRKAINHMNSKIAKQERSRRLKEASLLVREESMKINADFSDIEHDPKTK